MPEITHVGVLGCGLMGGGIAQVCVHAGFETTVRELSPEVLERGLDSIRARLARAEEKGVLTSQELEAALSRLHGSTELEPLASSDLIIEAVVEDLAAKTELWRALDGICRPEAIFASNTSSLSITEMAAATARPERLIGLHFFNPVPLMPLVEVVRTLATERTLFERAVNFVRALGKDPVECRDSSGFVVNRLLVPYLMDAIRTLEQGLASMEEIDRAMRLGAGHPMGPFTLCDFVGLDTLVRIGTIMFEEYHEQRFAAPPLLKRMVALGHLGRKNGIGFYDYAHDPPQPAGLGL